MRSDRHGRRPRSRTSSLAIAGLLAIAACGGDDAPASDGRTEDLSKDTLNDAGLRPGDPPRARRDLLDELRRARDATRSPADGGGRAWLATPEGGAPTARVGVPGTWTIVYAAGPRGIAEGGFVRLTVPPFWGWSTAQLDEPDAPGFTRVECAAQGVRLEPVAGQWIDVFVRDRALNEGEELRLVYGAGPAGATPDRFAERESRFWISVDGDGDGIGAVLADSPALSVEPGPAAQVVALWPSTARPGETLTLHLSVLDAHGSRGIPFEGELALRVAPEEGLEVPARVAFEAAQGGVQSLSLVPSAPGVYRVLVEARLGLEGPAAASLSNPLVVAEDVAPIRWGDLHGHSNLSDGTGTPEDYYAYARDVAALDVAVLTDHDHWGMLFLDERPDLWERLRAVAGARYEPGRFVTLVGYEWTNWVHGHRHVLYFGDDGPVLSAIDARYETPAQLWDALRGLPALTFAHHSAGGPIPTDWSFAPDPELEPVTEVVSVHGASEAADAPQAIYAFLPSNAVRDVLFERGYRLGFVGSGDSHDGHPGLAQLASPSGGLAAFLTEDLTREGVRAALVARRTYATNGPRIVLRAALGGHRMGEAFPAPAKGEVPSLYVRVIGTAPIRAIEVVTASGILRQEPDPDTEIWDMETLFELVDVRAASPFYVRALQLDGGCAWSSPFFPE